MSVVYIITREHGMSLVGAATREHMNARERCITGPTPHWVPRSGELTPSVTGGSTEERVPCALSRRHNGVGLGGGVWVSHPRV